MSPPLVVAFALAGRIDIDFDREPLAKTPDGKDVFLSDVWPSSREVSETVAACVRSEMFRARYSDMSGPERWRKIESKASATYAWDENSTYIQNPPFFESVGNREAPALSGLRPLAILGDSVTTDHISPAGSIPPDGPAGKYLRIRNRMAGGVEGGYTKIDGTGENVPIFDASLAYKKRGEGLIVFGGTDYGMGSSRDWAAKGTRLLGVRAVVAKSFERIHRSNLVGMGVLPFEFSAGEDAQTLGLDGTETFSILGLENGIKPAQMAVLEISRADGSKSSADIKLRIDTPVEADYYMSGGILPLVLEKIVNK